VDQEELPSAQEHLRLLGELSAALAELSQDDQAMLDLIARRTVEAVPEVCSLRLLSADGKRLRLASIYAKDPDAAAFVREILEGVSPLLSHQPQAAEALRLDLAVLSQELPAAYTHNLVRPELWSLADRFAPKRMLVVPMSVRGRKIGVLAIGRYGSSLAPFSEADQALAKEIAALASLAIENARLRRLLTAERETLESLIAEKTSELEEVRWKLEEVTRLQRATVDNANYAIVTTRLDGTIVTFNSAAERWLGYRARELTGTASATALHDPAELEVRAYELSQELGVPVAPGFEVLVTQARQGQSEVREWTYLGKEGVRFPVRLSVSAIRSKRGRISGFVCTASDLRAYRQAEEALEAERKLTRSILNAAGEGILGIDLRSHSLFLNPAATAMLGWSSDDLKIHNAHDLFHHSYADGTPFPLTESPIYLTCTRGTTFQVTDELFWSKDGRPVPVDYTSTPLLHQGEPMGAVVVFRDVTERQQTEAALREAQAEAERANAAKSEFLSRMSHELRTPLNAIIGFSQLLTRKHLPEPQAEYVGYIEQSGNHLLGLINEVLDISRIEAGRLVPSLEPIDLPELLGEVIALIHPMAAKRRLQLTQALPPTGSVKADRQRLKQVLLNLCSNAVKYNRDDGKIHVSAERLETGRFRIAVEDTGEGIAPEYFGRLFVPFERLDADRNNTEGSGLGLALSKNLVELMQGTLGFESVVGRGSTFWIELPPEPSSPSRP
jgi:PAS domain S-box-containing protein